jgi:hypothetical protein
MVSNYGGTVIGTHANPALVNLFPPGADVGVEGGDGEHAQPI